MRCDGRAEVRSHGGAEYIRMERFANSRRSLTIVFVIGGVLLLASACNPAPPTPTVARSACLLPAQQESAQSLGAPSGGRILRSAMLSSCYYPGDSGTTAGTFAEVILAWGAKAVNNFDRLHSKSGPNFGVTSSGSSIPQARFSEVSIDGTDAYWLTSGPSPENSPVISTNGPDAQNQLNAKTNGYVIIIQSSGRYEAQDERRMAALLSQL